MHSEAYLGIFRVREPAFVTSMPVEHECGLWQAWELPDGDFIVQPVDQHYTPLADSFLLDRMDFVALLEIVAGAATDASPVAGASAIDAASPDLLEYWYGQEEATTVADAASEPDDDLVEVSEDACGDTEELMKDALQNTPVNVDERIFAPVWHPDEIWSEQEKKPQPQYPVKDFPRQASNGAQKGGSFMSVLFGKKDTSFTFAPGRESKGTAPSDPAAVRPAGHSPKREKMPDYIDMQTLEKNMRETFDGLMEQAREVPQPALEQKIIALLSQEGPFVEEHKFLFSEFGLALRRTRKHYLALAAHKRALGLAPDDENILFNVARAEYELGNTEHAKACLEKAIALSPGFASAATFLSFLNGSSDEGE